MVVSGVQKNDLDVYIYIYIYIYTHIYIAIYIYISMDIDLEIFFSRLFHYRLLQDIASVGLCAIP